ncbi:MAG: PQQ-dependent sugar dehydrogenase [Mycobacterium sp.]|nr:PQQ-dependent sugar dehydrogenase [Mycobacterium sp.]
MADGQRRRSGGQVGQSCGWAVAIGLGAALLTANPTAWADAPSAESATKPGPGASGPAAASSRSGGTRTSAHRSQRRYTPTAPRPSEVGAQRADDTAGVGTRRSTRPVHRSAAVDLTARSAPTAPAPTAKATQDPPPNPIGDFLRQIQRAFFNQAPATTYVPSETTVVDGQILGNLNPSDPDGDAVTFTHTTPVHGAVEIQSDGTFIYTPGPDYPGYDTFEVTVSDEGAGLHLHGLIGLLNLMTFGLIGSPGHSTTRTVDIGFQRTQIVSVPNVPNLNGPVDFRFLPDGRIVLAEKFGAIRLVDDGVLGEPLIVLPTLTGIEKGVNGIEVDPDFEHNGYLYVAYTTLDNYDRLSRFTMVDNAVDPASELLLVEGDQPAGPSHHGGAIAFGPDGTIFYSLGDNTTPENSQDLSTLHGKILRLNPDGTIPQDNPFLGESDVMPQIYAYGFRNPYRMTIAPNGQLLVVDVGEISWEEVNLVTAGGNYGWWPGEGPCDDCDYINPIYAYQRDALGAALTSVLVYTGSTFDPSFQNKVFIADWARGWIKVLTCAEDYSSCGNVKTFDDDAGSSVNLLQGPDGNIYQVTYDLFKPGTINRIAPVG